MSQLDFPFWKYSPHLNASDNEDWPLDSTLTHLCDIDTKYTQARIQKRVMSLLNLFQTPLPDSRHSHNDGQDRLWQGCCQIGHFEDSRIAHP